MTTAILCAIIEEVEAILGHLNGYTIKKIAGREFYFATLENGKQVIVARSGVGKIEATLTTSLLISELGATEVIFSGVGGSLDGKSIPIGSLTLATHTCQGDFDITVFGLPKGINDGEEIYLKTPTELYDKAKAIANQQGITVLDAVICTQDSFIHALAQREEIKKHFSKANVVEMEGYAVAKTCDHLQIPYVIFRSISDDNEGHAHKSFEQFAKEVSEKHARLVIELATQI